MDKDNSMEKRKYKRLDNHIRVDFCTVSLQDSLVGLEWQKGHTRNVSQGGLCLDTEVITESMYNYFDKDEVDLKLKIFMPYQSEPVICICNVAWFQEMELGAFRIGLEFKSIKKEDLKRLTAFVSGTQWLINLAIFSSVSVLLLAVSYACITKF